uniref:Uncharacterized protein n=1 Tax=Rhizophora mucronata TaxID=61149 RepID=A0A2P2MMV7_RHIMU
MHINAFWTTEAARAFKLTKTFSGHNGYEEKRILHNRADFLGHASKTVQKHPASLFNPKMP